jgi:homoserine O-succinyltransferase/O-acetyltransferase
VPIGREPLVVGLVNNMPDAALRNTEAQFRRLIAAAGAPVRLRLFYLPQMPRSERGRSYLEQHYESVDCLSPGGVDGLIVTGTEPHTADLRDEPYWPALAQLVEWAHRGTISSVWSCLAAHAAVLHDDGISRDALPRKLCGMFTCRRMGDHPLVVGTPRSWQVVHSRHNGLSEASLRSCGYRMLSRSETTGPDLFIRQKKSLFVYFQGHPEYDCDSLAREYRRDVGRFLAGDQDDYPEMPQGYFDAATTAALGLFRRQALCRRSLDLLAVYPAAALGASHPAPSQFAAAIYRHWLLLLGNARDGRAMSLPAQTRVPAMVAMRAHGGE